METLSGLLANEVFVGLVGAGLLASAGYLGSKLAPEIKKRLMALLTCRLEILSSDRTFRWLVVWLGKQERYNSGGLRSWMVSSQFIGGKRYSTTLTPSNGFHFLRTRFGWMMVHREIHRESLPPWGEPHQTLQIYLFSRDRTKIEELLKEAQEAYYEQDPEYIRVSRVNRDGFLDPIGSIKRLTNTVVLPGDTLEKVKKDIQWFLNNRDWYERHGKPWRRGILASGMQGTGKTTLAKELAAEFGLELCIINLGDKDLDDRGLQAAMAEVNEKSLVLIEDVDTVSATHNRNSSTQEMTSEQNSVTLSGILNALDGIASPEGIVVYMTTNHPDKLDPALVRKGRCDIHLHFSGCTEDQIKKLCVKVGVHWPQEKIQSQVGKPMCDVYEELIQDQYPGSLSKPVLYN